MKLINKHISKIGAVALIGSFILPLVAIAETSTTSNSGRATTTKSRDDIRERLDELKERAKEQRQSIKEEAKEKRDELKDIRDETKERTQANIKKRLEKFLRNLPNVAKEITKCWGRDPVFIDVHLLDGDIRAQAFEQILSSTAGLDIFSIPVTYIIPVTSTDADAAIRNIAVKFAGKDERGLCIRIDESHL
ncbi:MAG: hypothetical protein AAB863_00415, partial [Patescibacteria group bacterium]